MNVAATILSAGADDAPAIVTQGNKLTYADLRRRVNQIAMALRGRGHAQGERIGILAQNSPFFVAAYLGVIRAGMVAVPLQSDLAPQALSKIAMESDMTDVLVSQQLFQRSRSWASAAKVPLLAEPDLEGLHAVAFENPPENSPNALAALMFTSGSTGIPKGVMITHRNIECNTLDIMAYMGLEARDRVMVVLPFHYCFGLSLLHTHLMAGASLVLNTSFRAFPEQMLQEMQQEECTGLAGVPSTFQILLRKTRFSQLAFPRLRWFQQAGGKLPNPCIEELLRAFRLVRFFTMYGQTEATARLSYLPPECLNDKLGSIGRGLPSTRLEVLKADGSPVAPGSSQVGEIVARGDNIALGYWKDPSETAAFFKNGRLHTGDLARVDEDGFIFFVERERDMLKPGGNRVSAREVEDVLAELPDVVEVAVIGQPHELLGETIHGFLVLRPDSHIGVEELLSHCRKRLPAYKTPHQITILSSMPHNAAGKVLKPKLREMACRPQPVPPIGLDQPVATLSAP